MLRPPPPPERQRSHLTLQHQTVFPDGLQMGPGRSRRRPFPLGQKVDCRRSPRRIPNTSSPHPSWSIFPVHYSMEPLPRSAFPVRGTYREHGLRVQFSELKEYRPFRRLPCDTAMYPDRPENHSGIRQNKSKGERGVSKAHCLRFHKVTKRKITAKCQVPVKQEATFL